jgi:hypothetical protein
MNFFEYDEQSEVLRNQNIPPPNSLSDADCLDPGVVRDQRIAANRYKKKVKAELLESNATADDLRNAEAGEQFMLVAEALPSIHRNLVSIEAKTVADLLMPQITDRLDQLGARLSQRLDRVDQRLDGMDQRLDGMDQRFNQIENIMAQGFHCMNTNMQAGFENISASREMDPIKPILIVGGNPVPPGFPQTRGAFYSLNGTVIQTFLNYYNIVCNGSLAQKKDALAAHLGLPPRR